VGSRFGLRTFQLVRIVDAGSSIEAFLVSAVASIVMIRSYLYVTGYPQIGGGGLHIAHMLWGGLLMLVALMLLLSFLGRKVRWTAAVIGGIGFGTFIDELGKFITSDNDYFYQPTFAVIYVIFILLFLASRMVERRRQLSPEEYLANAADSVVDVLLDKASREEVAHALFLLEKSGRDDPVVAALERAVRGAAQAPEEQPSIPSRLAQLARSWYDRLIRRRWFQRAILVIFVVRAASSAAIAVFFAYAPDVVLGDLSQSIDELASVVAGTASAVLAMIGVVCLRPARLIAFAWFKRSTLVSIFFSQVFAFLELQLLALSGLLIDLLVLAALQYMIYEERTELEAKLARRGWESEFSSR
jgi:hypothetical protein